VLRGIVELDMLISMAEIISVDKQQVL